jgi:hypothetical protein
MNAGRTGGIERAHLYGEVEHETQQGSASDDTNSYKWRQVAEFGWL